MPIKILGRNSSINVKKVLWTCVELGLAFEREEWGSGFRSTIEPEYLARNPNAQIPVIEDGDFVMWESNSIIRYLANRYGPDALYPKDPCKRARVDQWMDWQATDLNQAWPYAFHALARQSPSHRDPVQIAASCERWNQRMAILERQLATSGGHVSSPVFTLADIPVGLSVHRWLSTPLERPLLPAVSDYYARLSERPGFAEHGRNGTP